jgi:hypothetical protein
MRNNDKQQRRLESLENLMVVVDSFLFASSYRLTCGPVSSIDFMSS